MVNRIHINHSMQRNMWIFNETFKDIKSENTSIDIRVGVFFNNETLLY